MVGDPPHQRSSRAPAMVLGHNMRRALDAQDQGMAAIRQAYAGPIDITADHSCFVVIP